MVDRHKHHPIRFRPPETDRAWLQDLAERTGRPVNAILTEALSLYRTRCEGSTETTETEAGR
jgi:hypothetical protein